MLSIHNSGCLQHVCVAHYYDVLRVAADCGSMGATRSERGHSLSLDCLRPECIFQEAQHDTISAFEEYMDACMMSDWAAEKKALFDSALPDTALPGPAGQLAAANITAPYSPAQLRSTMPTGELESGPILLHSFLQICKILEFLTEASFCRCLHPLHHVV